MRWAIRNCGPSYSSYVGPSHHVVPLFDSHDGDDPPPLCYLVCGIGNSGEFFFLRPVLYLSIICRCFVPAPGKQLTNYVSVKRLVILSTMNQALDFVNPEQGHIAIRTRPRCRHCGEPTELRYGKPWNENGNEGRPYYICSCVPQKTFSCFADMRGVLMENPTCFCDQGMQFSRRGIQNPEPGMPWSLRPIFYTCATGGCSFYEPMTDCDGKFVLNCGPISASSLSLRGF